MHTVYSGIDLSKFSPRNGNLRKELDISEDVKLIGNTSALADHKDYYTFLDACKRMLEVNNQLQFIVMGDGPMRDEIHAYAKKLNLGNKVIFTGYRKDIPDVLADLDVFLITSKTEGLGTSILDAFACRVPVVATAAGGIPELVEHKDTGLLCEVRDSEGIAKAVMQVVNEKGLAEKLCEGAFLKVQKFSKVETAKLTLSHYEEVWS